MFEENYRTVNYVKFAHHKMICDICLYFRLGLHILRKRLGYAENMYTISGCSSHKYDTNIS